MTADLTISDYSFAHVQVDERTIGDAQTHIYETDELDYLYLELETEAGITGTGIDLMELRAPGKPSVTTLRRRVEDMVDRLTGEHVLGLLNRQTRHRGGVFTYESESSYGAGVQTALDLALWDAAAKAAGQPLYRYLGAERESVPVYASGLSFVNDDAETRRIYESFTELGEFSAAKVKVGHDSLDADIDRITLVDDVFGGLEHVLIDPNESWSPTETARRLRAFEDVGFDIYWVEDPVFRHDTAGMARLVSETPGTHVTVGEYVGFEAKRDLLAAGACDILNVQGISSGRRAATLAQAWATPVACSTDHATDVTGVHLGCALPDITYVECCYHRLFDRCGAPFTVEDGQAVPTDRPGHGIEVPETLIEGQNP